LQKLSEDRDVEASGRDSGPGSVRTCAVEKSDDDLGITVHRQTDSPIGTEETNGPSILADEQTTDRAPGCVLCLDQQRGLTRMKRDRETPWC
jgi:hypothetical protein